MKKFAVLLSSTLFAGTLWAQASLSLPAGTAMKLKLETTLATFMTKQGDPFSGRVIEPVVIEGKTVISQGATVEGRVMKATEPKRIVGKPTIAIIPETLILPNGQRYLLSATLVDTSLRQGTDVNEEGQFKGAGHDGKDVAEVAAGTGAGMLAGGLIGGSKGVVIGGAIGATATIVHWLSKHRSAVLPAGTELIMELRRPMTLSAASSGQ